MQCVNQTFNIDNGDLICWRHIWPRFAAYFGADGAKQKFLESEPAYGDGFQQEFTMVQWATDKKEIWEGLCMKAGKSEAKTTFDNGTWAMQDWPFRRTWSAVLSMNEAREFGWTGHIDAYESVKTWEKMRGSDPCHNLVRFGGSSLIQDPIQDLENSVLCIYTLLDNTIRKLLQVATNA